MFTKILTFSLLFLVAIGGFFVSVDDNSVGDSGKLLIFSIKINTSELYAADDPASLTQPNLFAGDVAKLETPKPSEAESKWLNDTIQAINVALGVLTVIVSPAIIFAGWLLSPDWTSGDLFGLREPMHAMWVIVSNIVYFIYAILLIIIALATIFGKENFSYKTMIPRLALGILMVPFTWWFVQWTISLATVVTASVINIPMDMIKADNKYINGNYIPREYYITTTTDGRTSTADSSNSTTDGKCNGGTGNADKCTNAQEILSKGGGTYSTLMIYAYQVFRVQDYKDVGTTLDKIKTAGQLLNNLLIGAIMFLVFGLLVMALIAMLLLRAIKLWMYAIFSPLFTLHFVAGKELFGKSTEGFDIKEFIGLCFVPAIVGLSLSFGLMIISVIQTPAQSGQPSCTAASIIMDSEADTVKGCTLVNLFGNTENSIRRGIVKDPKTQEDWMYNIVSIAGMKVYFKGKATANAAQEASTITGGLDAAGGIFGTLIVDIIALIFIWMAFMAAKGISRAVDAAVKPFEDMGNKIGSMAMSAPKYIPIPGTGGQSAASLQRATELSMNQIQENKLKSSTEKAGKLVPWAVKGIIQPEDRTAITEAVKTGVTQGDLDGKVSTIGSATGKAISKGAEFRADNFEVVSKSWQEVLKKDLDEGRMKTILRSRGFDVREIESTMKMIKGEKLERIEEERVWKAIQSKFGTVPDSTPGASGATGTTAAKTAGNNVNISIAGGRMVTVSALENDVTISKENLEIITKDKKEIMERDDFIQAMMAGGAMTQKAAEDFANKIKAQKADFFKEKPIS